MKILTISPDNTQSIVQTDKGEIRLKRGEELVKFFSDEKDNEKLPMISLVKWGWIYPEGTPA